MTTISDELLRDVGALLSGENDLLLALAFGSAASGKLRADSDLDIAVLARAPLSAARRQALIERLAQIAGRPVDLVDLSSAGVVVTGEALQGKRLLCKDPRLLGELISRNLTDVADFLPYHRRILDERRRAWTR